jgi:hypothetical protein
VNGRAAVRKANEYFSAADCLVRFGATFLGIPSPFRIAANIVRFQNGSWAAMNTVIERFERVQIGRDRPCWIPHERAFVY